MFAVALVGCSASQVATTVTATSPPGLSYRVEISSTFLSDKSAAIVAAADDWSRAVPELSLTVTISGCTPGPHMICVRPRTYQELRADCGEDSGAVGCTLLYAENRSVIGLSSVEDDEVTKLFAEHELGHAMGLKHSGPGTIMRASPDAYQVTDADVAQFWEVRR